MRTQPQLVAGRPLPIRSVPVNIPASVTVAELAAALATLGLSLKYTKTTRHLGV